MEKHKNRESRRKTPWDGESELTPTQEFLKNHYKEHYEHRHRKVRDSDEAELVNSYVPAKCPHCGSDKFKKHGRTKSGVQRYMCICKQTFLSTTGTIFDDHKISISEWMEYCLNLFRHVSINADSWNNKNAFTTSRYWLQKLFITLEDVQSSIVLSDKVWLDETFYTVRTRDIVRKEDGSKLSCVSRNQICIGVVTDRTHTIFYVEGTGKPTQKKTLELFRSHLKPNSTIIHDGEQAHSKLIKVLNLKSESYNSKELKGLPDNKNPLEPINRVHFVLTHFLNSHSGFNRNELQGYLNLFALISNPPINPLEKVELIVKTAFEKPKTLRYRDFFGVNTDF